MSIWNPSSKTNVKILERVQRRATKMVKSLESRTYEDRLKSMDLQCLETRRIRGDLIEMFKIVNGIVNVNLSNGINYAKSLSLNLRRQHDSRLVRELCKKGSFRHNFLTNRVVSYWNELPNSVITAKSVNSFKSRIDKQVFRVNESSDCNGPSRAKRTKR